MTNRMEIDCIFTGLTPERSLGLEPAPSVPEPPSVGWPNAKSSALGTKPQSIPPRGRWRQERPRATPEEVWESAKKRVCGLEVAVSAMIVNGFDETSSEVTSLKDSLAKAKRNAPLSSPVHRSS